MKNCLQKMCTVNEYTHQQGMFLQNRILKLTIYQLTVYCLSHKQDLQLLLISICLYKNLNITVRSLVHTSSFSPTGAERLKLNVITKKPISGS